MMEKRAATATRLVHEKASTDNALYASDFYGWTQKQTALLHDRRFSEMDVANIIEEIETLGRSERSALRSAYRLIALHLLKSAYQPERETGSWRATIVRERENIGHILSDNPGLKPQREDLFVSAYASARKEAAAETGLKMSVFPALAPFTVDDAEDERFPPVTQEPLAP